MFRSGSRVLLVVLLVVSSILATSLLDTQEAKAVELPSFRFPWPSSLNGEVKWVGGMHQYSNLNDAATVPINSGSGIDFASSSDPNFLVLSMAPGTVLFAGWGVFGNQVAVKHDQGGSVIIYGHLASIAPGAIEGLPISRGEPVGYAGNTTPNPPMNAHLHVELRDGSADCCLGNMGGNPVSWHGKSIDGWTFYEYRNNSESAATLMYNYDGVAVISSVLPVETAGIFTTNAAMTSTEYLYTHLPSGYECYAGGACDIQSTSADVAFSNHGSFGGGAAFYSSNTVSDPEPDPTPIPGPTDTPVPQYGDSHVDIREHANYEGMQFGWDNPTIGWSSIPDYMNDRTSSIALDSGWSIMVAQNSNGGGLKKCFIRSEPDLSNAYYDGGSNINDTITSVRVYHDTTCGGQYTGTEPGDTVTVWVDPNYFHTHFGWHDANWSGNVPDYVQNKITSIGIQPGWSAVLYENQNLGGGFACFSGSDADLTNNTLNNGVPVNDTVESVEIFNDSNCGGRMHPPTASFTAQVTNPTTKEVTNHLVWSGAAPTWQHFDFGDGSSFDVQGSSGDVSPTHTYSNFGTYTVTATVYGTDGLAYPYTQEVTIAAPTPSVSLSVNQGSGADYNYVEVIAEWSDAAEDWQIVNFGDGGEVGYFGSAGTSVGHPNGNAHWYECCGEYTITFNVRGLDGQLYPDTEVVDVQLPPAPTSSFTASVTDPISGLVETNAAWSQAAENWQVLAWGDGTETGYYGSSGTNVGHENGNTHYYQPGTYTLTFTVLDVFGQPHVSTQEVTINPPAPPTLSLAYTQGTGEDFNYVEVQAVWSGAAEDWQVVNWGDGAEVGYFGTNGTSVGHPNGNSHWYAVGDYAITFTVKGLDGQSYTETQTVSVSAPPEPTPIPQPTLSLTTLSADEQTNEVTVEATWLAAAEDWQVVDWGDGTSVGYFGANGTSVGHENGNTKVYNPGTFTITFNVKGLDGQTYTTTQQVTFAD